MMRDGIERSFHGTRSTCSKKDWAEESYLTLADKSYTDEQKTKCPKGGLPLEDLQRLS